jgi:hypothetical protein
MSNDLSARVKRICGSAKGLEDRLNAIGLHLDAQRVSRLRRGYITATNTLKTLHRDNMELRNKLELANAPTSEEET